MSGIRYSPSEINVIKDWEKEQFSLRFPIITYIPVTIVQSTTSSRFGKILTPENATYVVTGTQVNADFDFDRRKYKFENGIRIKTNNVEIILCKLQLLQMGLSPVEGDILQIGNVKYIILRVEDLHLIPSTTEFLHTMCVVDLQNTVKE